MPADQRLGPNDDDRGTPVVEKPSPEEERVSVEPAEFGTLGRPKEDAELVTKHRVLDELPTA